MKIIQKYQNGNIHRKLRVPTSEREGKLSNPRARAPRARDAWRKFKEIYGNPRGRPARAPCIDFLAAKYTVSILDTSERNGMYPGTQLYPSSGPTGCTHTD